jgi:hypothetical protein
MDLHGLLPGQVYLYVDDVRTSQETQLWRWGCQSYAAAAFYSPEKFFIYLWYSYLLAAE